MVLMMASRVLQFNNISLQEYTFLEEASYTMSRTNVDAEDVSTDIIAAP